MKGQFCLPVPAAFGKKPIAVLSKQNHSCFILGHSLKWCTKKCSGPSGQVGNRRHLEIHSQKRSTPGLLVLRPLWQGRSSQEKKVSTLRWILEQTLAPADMSEGWSSTWPSCTCVGERESVWGVEGSSRLKSWGPDSLQCRTKCSGWSGP